MLEYYFKLWKQVLLNPIQVFKKERKKASLNEGAKNIVISGLITGFIVGLAAFLGLSSFGSGQLVGVALFIGAWALTPIWMLIAWLIVSGVLYIVALLLGGKGSFGTQSHFIALYFAPMTLITTVLGLIPILGWVANFILFFYSLYLLTMALKEAHGFDTAKAVFVWLIPVIVVLLLAAIAFVALLGILASLVGSGFTPPAL